MSSLGIVMVFFILLEVVMGTFKYLPLSTHSFSIFIGPYGQGPSFHYGRIGLRLVYSLFLSLEYVVFSEFNSSIPLISFHYQPLVNKIEHLNYLPSCQLSHNMQWDICLSVCVRAM
jgi:hypothetical protein